MNPLSKISYSEKSQNRIRSMALVHERLYCTDSFIDINFEKYVPSLASELVKSSSEKLGEVKLCTEIVI